MERTIAFTGDTPLILVAPHGSDDIGTDVLTEKIADQLGAYAVINKRWRRAKKFDYWTDNADLNHVPHCLEDVVREEFLRPILNYKDEIIRDFGYCLILNIHGFGSLPGDEIEVIIGYGDGDDPSYTCNLELKDAFVTFLQDESIEAVHASRGPYAANTVNNLNQLFRFWYPDDLVDSMQLELSSSLRKRHKISTNLADAISKLIECDDSVIKTMSRRK